MAININVGMLGTDETKTMRAMWNLTNKVVLSQTTALPGSPTDGDIYIVPAAAGSHANEIAFRSEGAWLYLVPEAGWFAYVVDTTMLMFYSGTAWTEFEAGGGAGGDTIELSMFAAGQPIANELLLRHEFTAATIFPIDFAGSQASSGAATLAETIFTIRKNGASIGTATWPAVNANGAFVMATATSFAVNDVLSITAPATPDSLISDVSISIVGTLT